MKSVKGITLADLYGRRVPQHVQNIVIKDFARRIIYIFT